MREWIPFLPEAASTIAGDVDQLYFFLVGLSIFFVVLIGGLELYFALRYRRRSPDEIPRPERGAVRMEVVWIVVPLLLSMVIFGWGAHLYFRMYRMPAEAMQIYVIGKQWMWKLQHMNGKIEINELHVPVGRKVQLTMTSEDVIHNFFVPAFRVKKDVVPGRYSSLWFEARKPGRYHLFCAEYCGTNHSRMVGSVYVMEPADFQRWLEGGVAQRSPARSGELLFSQLNCRTCHLEDGSGRGPSLAGLAGNAVTLASGETVLADQDYLRESILNSQATIVSGFSRPSIMPLYQGQIGEEQLLHLIRYIQSIGEMPGSNDAQSPEAP